MCATCSCVKAMCASYGRVVRQFCTIHLHAPALYVAIAYSYSSFSSRGHNVRIASEDHLRTARSTASKHRAGTVRSLPRWRAAWLCLCNVGAAATSGLLADVAILLDCSKPSGAQGKLPVSYTTVVPAAIHSRCLWGGVCERYNNDTRYSLTCARGTIALLDWLNEAFSRTDFVVKVDTDALLLPAQVDSYVRSLASAVALDPKQVVIYAGNALRTYEYRRCEGVRVRGRSYCSSAGKPCGKLVCLRSTVQWQHLEASINPLRGCPTCTKCESLEVLARGQSLRIGV